MTCKNSIYLIRFLFMLCLLSSMVNADTTEQAAGSKKAIPEEDQSVLKTESFEIGPELYFFEYEEPGYMKDKGGFIGVSLGFTSRGWAGSLPHKRGGFMFSAEGRLAYGQVDYDGAVKDLHTGETQPYTMENLDDIALEGRLLLGGEFLGGNTLNTIYSGLAYRYLEDDSSEDPYGYLRQSNYFYLPVGYQFDNSHKPGWSIGFRVEYDVFLLGIQRTDLSNVGGSDFYNKQDSGYGCRASVKIQNKHRNGSLIIEPFFRYWDIEVSDIKDGWFEPANNTKELGVQVMWRF